VVDAEAPKGQEFSERVLKASGGASAEGVS
jgi:hypothetical protein